MWHACGEPTQIELTAAHGLYYRPLLQAKQRMMGVMRQHYLTQQTVTHDKNDFATTTNAYVRSYALNPEAEGMVQLIVTLICKRRTHRKRSDNRKQCAAVLRCFHGRWKGR